MLEKLVDNLRKKNYIPTYEGSLTKYLEVNVKYDNKGGFELVQSFLIERIIDLQGINSDGSNCNTRPVPAVKPLQHKDLEGLPRNNPGNYHTGIGMMSYLQGTTRSDFSMAVH